MKLTLNASSFGFQQLHSDSVSFWLILLFAA
uniref:Uncharacterized protein n=1 Tax=Anguilla anguilla TaxID=7936 RepID=A0A0E9RFC9_ANGAN